MSENVIQTSFAAGELAPSIFARTDLASYHQGLARCRNFFVDYRSGISSKQGQAFVCQVLKSSTAVRLISFSVSTTVTYIVEFGDRYCRFINQGAPVLEAPFSISGITNASPAVANVPGAPWSAGDWIFITGVLGMPAIDNRFFQVLSNVGGFVTLADVNGNPINSTGFGVYASGGTASRVYTIASPYAASDLFPTPTNPGLKFAQSVSVLKITHPSYPPTTLTFIAPTNWVFSTDVFGTTVSTPSAPTLTASSAGAVSYAYCVTAADSGGQESLPSAAGTVNSAVNIAATAGTIALDWPDVVGAAFYNIYKAEPAVGGYGSSGGTPVPGGAFGFIGQAATSGYSDSNIFPDFTNVPPATNNNPFANGNNPGCVSFFQQRLYYAGSNQFLSTFYASQPGAFNNYNNSNPVQASDSITGTIVSNQLNQIRHMLPMPGGLIFLTGRAAFTLTTGQGANATLAVTPLNATIMPQAYSGSSDVAPIVVNEDILYIQAKGSIVRDLAYNIYAAIYTGTDISVRSNHLFFNHTAFQWTYAEEPFKVIWLVRDDGILLSLTFMKEQQITGWAAHDTQGLYKSVASVQEGQVDAVYFVVQRLLPNGNLVQWIERQMERTFTYDAEDAWCVDAGTGNRNSLPTPNATITISGSTGTVDVVASSSVFSAGSVGQILRAGGGIITISSFTSSTQITGTVTRTVQQVIPNTGGRPVPFTPGNWSIATPATKFFGLDYLAGQTVSILADGGVVAPQVVASDGSITLASPATKVVAGLGFQCQALTMPLDVGEPTIQGKRKKIPAMNFKLNNTRGLKIGRSLSTLVAMKDMNINVPINSPIPLVTGDARIVMDPLWDVPGQAWMQIDDPLPATILGVIPEVVIGDTK